MKKAQERPDESVWLAVEREVADALTKRRRLREKTTVRSLKMKEDEDSENEEKKQAALRREFTRVVEEETQKMLTDDPEMVTEEIEILAQLKKAVDAGEVREDDEVLQTKIISPQEVSRKWKEWLPAVEAEVVSLLEEKEAMEEVSGKKLEDMLKGADQMGVTVEFLPSKLVFTKKPGKKGGKPKVRWVICGNFEQVKDGESTYSSGADAAALRLLLVTASRMQWTAGTIDVKTAFLNAVMDQKDQQTLILVKPPPLFVEKGYMKVGTYYLPKKAVYGLRRSPRLWGECRDESLEAMEVEVEESPGQKIVLHLTPLESEPNLWRVQEKKEDGEENEGVAPLPLKGLLMTYVDDILVAGSSVVVHSIMERIRSVWVTSDPDQVTQEPIKFLGVEISKSYNQEKGRDIWYMSQSSYTRDLLDQVDHEVQERKIPITRDQSQLPEEESDVTPELIKAAQKATGEMLWLVTRTRIDLMFAVSKMGSCVTRSPRKVLQIYEQIKGYLKKTIHHGLCFDGAAPEMMMIEAMADASFAPEGDVSHGAFIIEVGQCPVFWRSGRQSFVTLSTAEAEMVEVIESMVAGESIGAIADELFGSLPRKSWTDSQSALAILTTDGGSWRTRHLRLRAAAARHSIIHGMWLIQHMSGIKMTADIGTKPLSSERLRQLKIEMHMVEVPQAEKEKEKEKTEESGEDKSLIQFGSAEGTQKAASAVRLLTLAAVLSIAKGEEEEEEAEEFQEFNMMMVGFSIAIVLLTLLIQFLWKVGVEKLTCLRSQTDSAARSLPMDAEKEKEKEKKERKGEDAEAPAQESQGPLRRSSGEDAEAPAQERQGPLRRSSVGTAPEESTASVQPPRDQRGDAWGAADEVQRPAQLPPMGTAPVEMIAPVQPPSPSWSNETSSEDEEEDYRPLDERHIPVITQDQINQHLQDIEREEAEHYESARSDTERFREFEGSGNQTPIFQVWTTRYGSVYHHRRECRYLTSSQTGVVRESEWCWLCKTISLMTRGRPPPGVQLWIDGWGGPYHVDQRCPLRNSQRVFRACQGCDEDVAG